MIQIPAWALPYVFVFALLLGLAFAFWLRTNHPKIAWAIQNWISDPRSKPKMIMIISIIIILESLWLLVRR